MTVNIALLGLGKMGQNHLNVLKTLNGVNVKHIFDHNPNSLEAVQGFTVTDNLTQALTGADAAIIATPTSTHFDILAACVPHIKHIFLEKPIASTAQQGAKIVQIAKKMGLNVQCGFIERFNPVTLHLAPMLKDQHIIATDFTRTSRESARITDVDVVLDLMIHDIDLAHFFNGPIARIQAQGAYENGLIAHAAVQAVHENGTISRLLASRMMEKKMRNITISTNRAYIEADLLTRKVTSHQQSQSAQESTKVAAHNALAQELSAFAALVESGVPQNAPYVDAGFAAQKVAGEIVQKISDNHA